MPRWAAGSPLVPRPSAVPMIQAPDAAAATIRPISHPSTNDRVMSIALDGLRANGRLLDVGAGRGYFSMRMGDAVTARFGAAPATMISACDVHPENFAYTAVPCDRLDPDAPLPYADASFDVVCSVEVIEHVEDQFRFLRELLRVVKPGGLVVVSTPNVLNANSRWRNLHSGFAVLFDPLSLTSGDVVHTSGHIHPISYYYAAMALRRAGAREVTVAYDRLKLSARFLTALLLPVIVLGQWGFRRRLQRRQPAVLAENASILAEQSSLSMLLSRSIILVATR